MSEQLLHARKVWWRRDTTMLARLAIIAVLIGIGLFYLAQQAPHPSAPSAQSCRSVPPQVSGSGVLASSSVLTIQEAYNCILDTYPANPPLDDRLLLTNAMSGIVNALVAQHIDQSSAVLPAFTGERTSDWQAFAQTYNTLVTHLPATSTQQQRLVNSAITAMTDSLHDDHAAYYPAATLSTGESTVGPGMQTGLGLHFAVDQLTHATPPLLIVAVDPGSPAELAGIRPGDSIVSVNGVTPFVRQQPMPIVMNWLFDATPKQMQIQHPGSNQVLSLHLTSADYPALPVVSSRMLPGNIIYIQLRSFDRPVSEQVLVALQDAGLSRLKGIVLDLRGNGGGAPDEQGRIISLFVHHQTLAIFTDRQGKRSTQTTNDTMPLLHIPLVALIDRVCASACDAAAADIYDLHLGRLVGERTAGEVSGPAGAFFLDDGSALKLPASFMHGPNGETVDGIGVPPDIEVQPNATALAAGNDPVLSRAIQMFS